MFASLESWFLEFPDIILQTSISEAFQRRGALCEMTAWLTFIKCSSFRVHWWMTGACGVSLSVCQGWNLEPVWKKPCMRARLLWPLRLVLAGDNGITVCVSERPRVQDWARVDESSRRRQRVFVHGFALVWMGTLRHEPNHQPAT